MRNRKAFLFRIFIISLAGILWAAYRRLFAIAFQPAGKSMFFVRVFVLPGKNDQHSKESSNAINR